MINMKKKRCAGIGALLIIISLSLMPAGFAWQSNDSLQDSLQSSLSTPIDAGGSFGRIITASARPASASDQLALLQLASPVCPGMFSSFSVSGSDGISGYAGHDDTMHISVTIGASVENGADINGRVLLLFSGSSSVPMSCSEVGAGCYQCSYDEAITPDAVPDRYALTVRLNDDAGNSLGMYDSGSIAIDALGPRVTSLAPARTAVGPGMNVSVALGMEEQACGTSRCTGICSGFSSLNLYQNDQLYDSINISGQSGCTFSSVLSLPMPSLDGNVSWCVAGVDRVGNEGDKECVRVLVDTIPPALAGTAGLYDTAGRRLSAFSGRVTGLVMKMNFTDALILRQNVRADLSAIDPDRRELIIPQECIHHDFDALSGVEDIWECRWDYVAVNVNASGDYPITFHISDANGNNQTITDQLSLLFDTESPIINYIGTDHLFNGRRFVNANNDTLVVDLIDTGVGFNNSQVFVSLSAIGGPSTARFNCTNEGNWRCYYNITNAQPLSGHLTPGTIQDDVGMPAVRGDGYSDFVIVDGSSPGVAEGGALLQVPGLPEQSDNTSFYAIKGKDLHIKVLAADQSGVNAAGSFNQLSMSPELQNLVSYNCSAVEDDLYSCDRDIPVDASAGNDKDIMIRLVDAVGNMYEHHLKIDVLAETNDTENAWRAQVMSVIPNVINFESSQNNEQKVMVLLKVTGGSASSLLLRGVACQMPGITLEDIKLHKVSDNTYAIRFTIPQGGIREAGRNITNESLGEDDVFVSNITANCSFMIHYRQGLNAPAPEKEDIAFNITLYRNLVKELNSTALDEARRTIGRMDGIAGNVKSMNKMISMARTMCTMSKIAFLIQEASAETEQRTAELAPNFAQAVSAGSVMTEQTARRMYLTEGIYQLCAFVMCESVLKEGTYDKCVINKDAPCNCANGVNTNPIPTENCKDKGGYVCACYSAPSWAGPPKPHALPDPGVDKKNK